MADPVWTYRDHTIGDVDLVGYDVEAKDGSLGEVKEASYDTDAGYLVVDTSTWKDLGFGDLVLVPAGMVESVDGEDEKVHLGMAKEDVRDAPAYEGTVDGAYRDEVSAYWEPYYPTARTHRTS